MRTRYLLMAFLSMVMLMTSCEKDDELNKRTDETEDQAQDPEVEPQLSLAFNYDEDSFLKKGVTVHIGFTITSNLSPVQLEVVPEDGLKAVLSSNGATGDIAVTLESLEDSISTQMVVIASNGKNVEMKKFTFTEGGIEATDNQLKEVTKEGGNVTLEFLTNETFDLIIEDNASSWISQAQTKAMEKHALILAVAQNQGISRSATVTLKGQNTGTELVYTISQNYGYKYGITLEHHQESITAPTIVTRAEGGAISWGDGQQEAIKQGASHTYKDGKESHLLTVGFSKISGFSIDSMEGVSMIDMSTLLSKK